MKTILVVDDHADIRRLVAMTLELHHCEVHESNCGFAALLRAVRLQPDVMLVDVMMPGSIDGLELCRRVKTDPRLRHTRLVMLSALDTRIDILGAMDAGADDYLVKPFSPLQLIELVECPTTTTVPFELGARAHAAPLRS